MIDLDRQDIVNLLAALNAIDVKGKDAMLTLLRLMQKLENALKPEAENDPSVG
jgi:hypothetical protein